MKDHIPSLMHKKADHKAKLLENSSLNKEQDPYSSFSLTLCPGLTYRSSLDLSAQQAMVENRHDPANACL